MKLDNSFCIKLTQSELSWLAMVLGYIQIPLLGPGTKNGASDDLKSELEGAQAKLQKRGLITYHKNSGYRIERLVAVLMQIIANPDTVHTLQQRNKREITRRAFAYMVVNFPLFIEETDELEFTIFPSHDGLLGKIKAFLDLPARSRSTGDPIIIRDPETITPKIWNDPKETPKDVVETGKALENIQLSFINQMENIGVSSELKNSEGELSPVRSKCFLWNTRSIWGGTFASDNTIEFLPLTRRAAHKLLEPG